MKIKSLLFFVMMSLSVCMFPQEHVIDQVIAIVGKNLVLQSDIENQYLQLKAQGYVSSSSDLKCDILEELLYQKLLLTQAQLDSVEVTSREVDYAMDNRFRQIIGKIGSEEALEEYFGKSILEMKADLKEELRDQLLTQKMQGKITENLKITPAEIRAYFKKVPKDSIPLVNTQYEIEQIVLYPEISELETQKVKDKISGLRERVINGENFATLAVLYSEDPGTSAKGGELGVISRDDPYASEFLAVAFNLKKENEVSRIVETEFGFHIIQLIEKKGELINVRHILIRPKVSPEQMMESKKMLDSIKTVVQMDSLTFSEAAELFSEDEESKNSGGLVINPYTGDSKFEDDYLEMTEKVVIDRLGIGDVSNPFESKDYSRKTIYKIIRLKTKTEPHQMNLKDDYKLAQDYALADKKQRTVNEWLKNKIERTYIRIDDSYMNCEFQMKGWIK